MNDVHHDTANLYCKCRAKGINQEVRATGTNVRRRGRCILLTDRRGRKVGLLDSRNEGYAAGSDVACVLLEQVCE